VTTGNAAWNATDATYLAAINTALDTATGVVGGIVASAIPATDTDLGIRLTYSGVGYAGKAWTKAIVAVFPTSSTAPTTPGHRPDERGLHRRLVGRGHGRQPGPELTILPDGCADPGGRHCSTPAG
jgi:hypothetical protein